MRIAFCASEVVPFAKTGGMADVCGALPLALEELGHDIVIVMPRYKGIKAREHNIKKINHLVSTTTIGKNIHVLFIESSKYFKREGLYGDKGGDYHDNLERFRFFCTKTLEVFKQLNLKIDIVHCHDWQTALIPVYMKNQYGADPFYKRMKSILTIHNLAFQGVFPRDDFSKLKLPKNLFHQDSLEFYNQLNLLKGGIIYSDRVTTVSEQYAKEIQTETFGCGLEGVLRSRGKEIVGILNGIDEDVWNPKTDSLIEKKYSQKDVSGKAVNKQELQKICQLPVKDNVPVFGFVGRLSHQKGIDLIELSMHDLMAMDLQLIFLGLGDSRYEDVLKKFSGKYSEKVAVHFHFNEQLAHLIYAGSDIFLMPSVYEPCGLSQMISLRFGTIPLVHKTGGLADTIQPLERGGNGFVFDKYNREAFTKTVKQAVDEYSNKERFAKAVEKAFKYQYDWHRSAKAYEALYDSLREK